MQQVQLKINQESLVNNLRFAFTNKQTVLSELMQNARRAGSDFVAFDYNEDTKVLVVSDKGCGLDDPQKILTIAESGWSEETQQSEGPYGLGFMSALFSAEHVKIESNGSSIEFHTESVLSFNFFSVVPSTIKVGTRITLTGIDLDVKSALEHFSKGYPIKVFYNGEEMERKHALSPASSRLKAVVNGEELSPKKSDSDSISFIETDIGSISVVDLFEPIKDAHSYGTHELTVYLQGIQVFKSNRHYNGRSNIVHLDSTKFKGRLPDRDRLIDEADVVDQIQNVIKSLWKKRLVDDVSSTDHKYIATYYYSTLQYWGQIALLNDVTYLPTEVLGVYDIYPIYSMDYEDEYSDQPNVVPQADIESGEVQILYLNDEDRFEREPYQVWMYAYYLEAIVLVSYGLDKGHWVYQHQIKIEREDITMTLVKPQPEAYVGCAWFDSSVVFCQSAILHGPCGDVTILSDGFYFDEGVINAGDTQQACENGFIVIPENEQTGQVVRQLASYRTEWEFLDNEAEEDQTNMENFIMANRPEQEERLLQRLLLKSGMADFTCLKDKTFKVTVLNKWDEKTSSNYKIEFE